MAKRYKLTLENVALAVEQCPYVACKGPYWDDYEIMPSKDFLTWVDENAEHYGLKVYRKPDEAFFRVEVVPNDQKVSLGTDFWVGLALNIAAISLAVFTITSVIKMVSAIG